MTMPPRHVAAGRKSDETTQTPGRGKKGMGKTMRINRDRVTAWPEGDDLGAASLRGDTIREILRERGYESVSAIVADLLASLAVGEQREKAEWAWRAEQRGALVRAGRLHTLSPRDCADAAVEEVESMVEEITEWS